MTQRDLFRTSGLTGRKQRFGPENARLGTASVCFLRREALQEEPQPNQASEI